MRGGGQIQTADERLRQRVGTPEILLKLRDFSIGTAGVLGEANKMLCWGRTRLSIEFY